MERAMSKKRPQAFAWKALLHCCGVAKPQGSAMTCLLARVDSHVGEKDGPHTLHGPYDRFKKENNELTSVGSEILCEK